MVLNDENRTTDSSETSKKITTSATATRLYKQTTTMNQLSIFSPNYFNNIIKPQLVIAISNSINSTVWQVPTTLIDIVADYSNNIDYPFDINDCTTDKIVKYIYQYIFTIDVDKTCCCRDQDEVIKMYENNRKAYLQNAKQWTKLYAAKDQDV